MGTPLQTGRMVHSYHVVVRISLQDHHRTEVTPSLRLLIVKGVIWGWYENDKKENFGMHFN